jgi:hypothetical protein
MQMNFNRMIDNFRDNAADRVNRATGSNVAGFITYTLVDAHKMAFNAPSYAYNAVKNGYNRGGQIISAGINDPTNVGKGIVKAGLNFGPEAFNGATNLLKTSLDGYSYAFGEAGESFRTTDAYNLTTQRYYGDAQLTGGIVGTVATVVGPAAAAKLGAIRLETAVNQSNAFAASKAAESAFTTGYQANTSSQALRNALVGSSVLEAEGIVYGIGRMDAMGYDLIDQSFAYSGRQGIDGVFINRETGRYATAEFKNGSGLASLVEDTRGLRQGSRLYNESRVINYIDRAANPNIPLARNLLAEIQAGNVDSFASFSRGKSLYQLNFEGTVNFRLNPEAAIKR